MEEFQTRQVHHYEQTAVPEDAPQAQDSPPRKSDGHAGVCWHTEKRRWLASIVYEGRNLFLGDFAEEEDAARLYNDSLRRLRSDQALGRRSEWTDSLLSRRRTDTVEMQKNQLLPITPPAGEDDEATLANEQPAQAAETKAQAAAEASVAFARAPPPSGPAPRVMVRSAHLFAPSRHSNVPYMSPGRCAVPAVQG